MLSPLSHTRKTGRVATEVNREPQVREIHPGKSSLNIKDAHFSLFFKSFSWRSKLSTRPAQSGIGLSCFCYINKKPGLASSTAWSKAPRSFASQDLKTQPPRCSPPVLLAQTCVSNPQGVKQRLQNSSRRSFLTLNIGLKGSVNCEEKMTTWLHACHSNNCSN